MTLQEHLLFGALCFSFVLVVMIHWLRADIIRLENSMLEINRQLNEKIDHEVQRIHNP